MRTFFGGSGNQKFYTGYVEFYTGYVEFWKTSRPSGDIKSSFGYTYLEFRDSVNARDITVGEMTV